MGKSDAYVWCLHSVALYYAFMSQTFYWVVMSKLFTTRNTWITLIRKAIMRTMTRKTRMMMTMWVLHFSGKGSAFLHAIKPLTTYSIIILIYSFRTKSTRVMTMMTRRNATSVLPSVLQVARTFSDVVLLPWNQSTRKPVMSLRWKFAEKTLAISIWGIVNALVLMLGQLPTFVASWRFPPNHCDLYAVSLIWKWNKLTV